MNAYAQPTIVFSPTAIPGIELVTSLAAVQQELNLLGGIDPAVRSSPLLRFCYLLRNRTNRHVIVYATRWTRTSKDNKPATVDAIWWNLDARRGGDDIKPGETRLVSPIYRFGLSPAQAGQMQSSKLEEFLAQHDGATDVTVSLEAVVFDTGEAYGPDRSNAIGQAQATLDARRQISEEFISRAQDEADSQQLPKWLDTVATAPRNTSGDASSYGYVLDLTRRSLALFLKDRIRSGARAGELAADLKKYLDQQTLVEIRRK